MPNTIRMTGLKKQLQSLPKADVHNHLHLSGAIQLLRDHYPNIDFKIPRSYDGFAGMMRFIVQHVNSLMQSSDDVIALMEAGVKSAIMDNVQHLEASVDLDLVKYFDNSADVFMNSVKQLKHKYREQIDFRPEIGIKKNSPLEMVYQNGMACIESDVFEGIDIYGQETGEDLSGFKEIFQRVRTLSKKTKVHIGEFSDHRSVERAIVALEPDEIQHGIRASDSDKTIQMILERNIRLNICPQSNVALGAAKTIAAHPVRKLYDAGVKLTINTDDLLLFEATITDQFAEMIKLGIFSFDEINEIRQNALIE